MMWLQKRQYLWRVGTDYILLPENGAYYLICEGAGIARHPPCYPQTYKAQHLCKSSKLFNPNIIYVLAPMLYMFSHNFYMFDPNLYMFSNNVYIVSQLFSI